MKRRAFSLAEMIVALFLLGTMMAMALALFFPTLWMFRAESGRNDVQQSVLLLTNRLRTALLNTATEWVSLAPDGSALSVRSLNEQSPFDPVSGAAQFRPEFVVYHYQAARRRVLTRPWPPGPPSPSDTSVLERAYDFASPTLEKLSGVDLLTICSQTSPEERVLAREVELFTVYDQDASAALLTPPIQVRVACKIDNVGAAAGKSERYELTFSVTPRSQRW